MQLTPEQSQELQETLEHFGLSRIEQKAYFILLQHGRMTATPLAKNLRVPLTTAQSLLQRLASKGIVHVSKQRSRSTYEAKDPGVFKLLLEQQLQEMGNAIPLLRQLQTERRSPARIRIFERDRMTDIFRQALLCQNKLVYEIVSAREIQETLGQHFHFTKRRVANGIHLKSLRIETNEIKKYNATNHVKELREAKFLPRDLTFRCSILFWDDTAAFFTPESEGLAWLVKSSSFVEMLKQLFDLLWGVSRKMETLN